MDTLKCLRFELWRTRIRIPKSQPMRVELHVARGRPGVGIGYVGELLHQLVASLARQCLAEHPGDVRPRRRLRVAVRPRS